MSPTHAMRRVAQLAVALVALTPAASKAGSWSRATPPPSRYAMPEPLRGPDLDELINGNGKLHFSGQWRHPGDSRNTGELAQMLLAPETVPARAKTPNGLPISSFCNDNPDEC